MAEKPQVGTDLSDVGRGAGKLIDTQALLKLQYDPAAYYYDKFKQDNNAYLNDQMWVEAAKRGETANLVSLLSHRAALDKQKAQEEFNVKNIETPVSKIDTQEEGKDWYKELNDKYKNYMDYDTYMMALNMPFYDNTDETRQDRINKATGYNYGNYTDREWAEEIMNATIGRYEAQIVEDRKANRSFFQAAFEEMAVFLSDVGYRVGAGILKGFEGLSKAAKMIIQAESKLLGFKPSLISIIKQVIDGENLWEQDLNEELAKIANEDSILGKVADNMDDIAYYLEYNLSDMVDAVDAYDQGYRPKNFDDLGEGLNPYISSEGVGAGYNWWGKVSTGAMESIGEMVVPTILTMGASAGIQASTISMKALRAVKTALFYTSMTGNNVSDVVKSATANGLALKDINMGQVIFNETVKSTAQLGLELLLGKFIGFTKADKLIGLGAGEEAAVRFIGKTEGGAIGRAALGIIKDMFQEGLEEVLQDTSDAILNYFYAKSGGKIAEIYSKMNEDFGLETLWISFAAGALTSFVISSFDLYTKLKSISENQLLITDKGELKKLGLFQTYNYTQALALMEEWNNIVNDKTAKVADRIEAGAKLKATINTMGNFYRSIGADKAAKVDTFMTTFAENQTTKEAITTMSDAQYTSRLFDNFVKAYDEMMAKTVAKATVKGHQDKYNGQATKNIFSKIKGAIGKLVQKFKKQNVTELNNVVSNHTVNNLSNENNSAALKILTQLGDGDAIVGYNGLRMLYQDGIYFVPNAWLESGEFKEIVRQRGYELVRETVISNLNKSQREFIMSMYNKTVKSDSVEIEDAINSLLFDRKFYSQVLMQSESRRDKGAALQLFSTIDQIINNKAKVETQNGTLSDSAYKTLMNRVYSTMRTGLINYLTRYENIDLSTINENILSKDIIKDIQQNKNVIFSELINRLSLATINPDQRAAEYEKILTKMQNDGRFAGIFNQDFLDLLHKQIRGDADGLTDAISVLKLLNNTYNYFADSQKLVYLPADKENEQVKVYLNNFTNTVGISYTDLLAGKDIIKLDAQVRDIVQNNNLDLDNELDRISLATMMIYNISQQTLTVGNNGELVSVFKAEDIMKDKYTGLMGPSEFRRDLLSGKIKYASDAIKINLGLPDVQIKYNAKYDNAFVEGKNTITLNSSADINTLCHEMTHATQLFMKGESEEYALGGEEKIFDRLPKETRLSLENYISTHFPAMYELLTSDRFKQYGNATYLTYSILQGELQAFSSLTLNMSELGFRWKDSKSTLVSPDGKTEWSMKPDSQKAYKEKTAKFNKEQKQSKDIVLSDQTDSQDNQLTEAQVEYFKDSKIRDKDENLLVVYHGTDAEFDTFQKQKPKNGQAYGDGFYFSTNENRAKGYGDNIIKAYLNITNPTTITNLFDGMSPEQILDTYFPDKWTDYREGGIGYIKGKLTSEYNKLTLLKFIAEHNNKEVSEIVKELGFDGIIVADQIVAYEPNQIKRTDNLNPTSKAEMSKELKLTEGKDYDRAELIKRVKANVEKQVWNKVADNDPKFANKSAEQIKAMIEKRYQAIDAMSDAELEEKYPKALAKLREETAKAKKDEELKKYQEVESKKPTDTTNFKVKKLKEVTKKEKAKAKNRIYITNKVADQSNMKYFKKKGKPIYIHQGVNDFVVATTDYYNNLSDAKKENDPIWKKIRVGKLNYNDISQYVKSADKMPNEIWQAIAEYVYKNNELAKLTFEEMKDLRDNIEVYATIAMVAEELEKREKKDSFNRGEAKVNTEKMTYKQLVDMKNNIQEQMKTDQGLAALYARKNKIANSTKTQDGIRVEAFADPKQSNIAMLTTYNGTLGSLRWINFKGTLQSNQQTDLQLIENADSGQIEGSDIGGWNWTDKKTLATVDYTNTVKEELAVVDRVDKENFLEDYYKNTVIKKLNTMSESDKAKYTPERVAALLEKRFAELSEMNDEELDKRYLIALSKTAEGKFETSETSTPYEEQAPSNKNTRENAKQKLNRLASLITNKREYDALPNELKEYIDFKSYRDKNKSRLKEDIDWKTIDTETRNKLGQLAIDARDALQAERKVAQKAMKSAEQNEKRLQKMSERLTKAEEEARKAKKTIREKLEVKKVVEIQNVPFVQKSPITDTARSLINTEWDKTRMSTVQELSNNKEQVVANAKQFFTENAEAIMNADLNEIENTAKWFIDTMPATRDEMRKFEALRLYFLGYVYGETGDSGIYANMNANLKTEIENALHSDVSTGATAMAVWNNIKSIVNPLKAMESHALVMDGVTIPADLKAELFEAMNSTDMQKIQETQEKLVEYVISKKIKNKTKTFFQRAVAYRSLAMLSSPVTWLRNKVSNMIIKPLNKLSSKIGNAIFKGHTAKGQLKLDTDFSVKFDKNGKPIFKGNITPEIQQYIVKNFIDNGLFDKFVKNLSKYNPSDIKEQYKTKKGTAKKEAVFAQLVLKSMYNQYYNTNVFGTKWGNKLYTFIMDRLSDDSYVREAAVRYFGKILSERNYNLLDKDGNISSQITDDTMSDFSISLGLALSDYMHSDNFLSKFENVLKDNTAAWFAYKTILPFASASWNWFKGAMNLSPLGLARAIYRFTRLENSIKKSEELWSKGKSQLSPELTEYKIRRDLGQGIIGTIGWGLGILLAALGVVRLKDDDYGIPKLEIGNLSIDISSIFGSNSILAGAAMMKGWQEGDIVKGLNQGSKVMLDNMPLMELLEIDMYSSGPVDMLNDYIQQSMLSYIPNAVSWMAGATYSGNLKKDAFWKRAVAKIPFLNTALAATGVLDKKVDIYTGSTGSYIDALNRIIPYFSYQIASTNERKTLALGLNKTMLRGQYTINGQSFVVTGTNLQKLNEKYGQWNAEDLTKFYDNKMRVKVKVGNTYKMLTYSQMNNEQRKNAVQTIMSNNAELTKITAWLSKGHKYYASDETYKKLISKGIKKNVYKGTKGFVE